jgi:E3 ubiquitin-protein ligase DOA10
VAEWREKVLARPVEPVKKSLVPLDKSAVPPTQSITSSQTSWKPATVVAMLLCIIGILMYYFIHVQPAKNNDSDRLQNELNAKLRDVELARRRAEAEANAATIARQRQEQEAAQAREVIEARQQAEATAMAATEAKKRQEEEAEQARRRTEEQAVVNLVKDYYADLNRNDADSAISKRKSVSNEQKLRSVINGIESFRVNEVSLTEMGSGYATVQVNVTGKQKKGSTETWTGTIELEKNEWSEWKITTLNLTKGD